MSDGDKKDDGSTLKELLEKLGPDTFDVEVREFSSKDLDAMEAASEQAEYESIVMQMKLLKAFGFPGSWERITQRMLGIYKRALVEEFGPEAFEDFKRGLAGKLLN